MTPPSRKVPASQSVRAESAPEFTGTATINDIARLSGVSKKTVSRVINRSPLVRDDTRDKVLALMERVGYVPDPQARGLAFRRSFLIGLVYDNPNAQYIVNIQNGALDTLRHSGFELVVHPCDSRSDSFLADVRQFVLRQKLHGVILLPPVSEDPALAKTLADAGCRYVRVASVPLDEPSRVVVSGDREASAEVANYLESLGHREIGLITGPDSYRSSHERGEGFADALTRRGIKLPAQRIVQGGYTYESGVACAERLLSQTPRPTAIFACNDEMAAGVYKTASRLGISVPEQLSVVGFDDSPLASRLQPALTTVRLPIRDMGRQAADILLSENASRSVPTSLMAHLAVRESCQPPAIG